MRPQIPDDLLKQAEAWERLNRWEQAELGRTLRRLGATYGEIRSIVPVPKSTLANWCREIALSQRQIDSIRQRTASQKGIPRDTQRHRRQEVERIRAEAITDAAKLINDARWTAGVALYWGEGSKTERRLSMSNADPRLLRAFVGWIVAYLDHDPDFSLALHLHRGNDERAAQEYWASALGVSMSAFTKTYFKPAGTGHRKNHLPNGVCRVTLRKSADAWLRAMEWIDVLSTSLPDACDNDAANLLPGR